VQFGENARERVTFICNCCGCCCEAMIAARRFGFLHPVHTTNFVAALDATNCNGCSKCVDACPVEALSLVSANDSKARRKKVVRLSAELCLGCGVCVGTCPKDCLRLAPRAERVITPLDATHRVVVQAIERGQLQDLIFDNRALASHRAMAAILGVILRLPPVKRTMASRQVKSRYLEAVLRRAET
jgi:ferredoxin